MDVDAVMSSPAITATRDSTLADAVDTMLEHRIGSVVVVAAAPVGILTRTDVLVALRSADDPPLSSISVETAMSSPPVTIAPSSAIETAVRLMAEHEIKRLPVMDELQLVGIVTMTDLATHLPERVQEVRAAIERTNRWGD